MKIYDISKPFFGVHVYPGDPEPEAKEWFSIEKGDVCNLHTLFTGTHNSTHVDAPMHFLKNGVDVSEIPLEKFVGKCKVKTVDTPLTADVLSQLLSGCSKLLIHGEAILTPDGAEYLAQQKIDLFGTEINTVGDNSTGPQVHRTLLSAGIVILENLDLSGVEDGEYILCAQPLKLEKMDGSPVRAVLMDMAV